MSVKNNNCNHLSNKNLEKGKTLGLKWHPNKEEKDYLKKKRDGIRFLYILLKIINN